MIIVVLKKVVTHNIVWRIMKGYTMTVIRDSVTRDGVAVGKNNVYAAMPVARDVVACDGVVAGIINVYTPSVV